MLYFNWSNHALLQAYSSQCKVTTSHHCCSQHVACGLLVASMYALTTIAHKLLRLCFSCAPPVTTLGSLPATWAEHPNLREISLYGCSLSGSLPASWGGIKRLRQLYLQNNKLSGPLPAEWGSLTALNNLGLATNEFTGSIPSTWSGMRSLKSM